MNKKIAIIPGSFDPMTLGHLSIITKAADIFDEVIVAIMNNPDKNGFLTVLERKIIAEKTCASVSNVKVLTADGFLVDLAKALGAKYIVKGVRNTIDFEYEQSMAKINRSLNSSVQTIYIPADFDSEIISSSLVRELIRNGKSIDLYIHPDALQILKK